MENNFYRHKLPHVCLKIKILENLTVNIRNKFTTKSENYK